MPRTKRSDPTLPALYSAMPSAYDVKFVLGNPKRKSEAILYPCPSHTKRYGVSGVQSPSPLVPDVIIPLTTVACVIPVWPQGRKMLKVPLNPLPLACWLAHFPIALM